MRLLEIIGSMYESRLLVERDVANAGELKKWVSEVSSRVTAQIGRTWLNSQLFQFIVNRVDDSRMVRQIAMVSQIPDGSPDWLVQKVHAGQPVYQITVTPEFTETVNSVVDWLNNWCAENPGSRINYTWEQAVKDSHRWHKELARGKSFGDETFDDPGIATIVEYPDGARWVDVQTEVCLKREGGRMGHCVGSYHDRVSGGSTKIFSLRDAKNRPHVTIRVENANPVYWHPESDQLSLPLADSGGSIAEVKGKQNQPPVARYLSYVKDFITRFNVGMEDSALYDLEKSGLYWSGNTVKTLSEIAVVYKKYPSGWQWVVSKEGKPLLKLTDKKWNIALSCNLNKDIITNISKNTTIDAKTASSFILDINSDPEFNIAAPPKNLAEFKIWSGSHGISVDPRKAGPSVDVGGGYTVCLLDNFTEMSFYGSPLRKSYYLVTGDGAIVGKVNEVGVGDYDNDLNKTINERSEVAGITFYGPIPRDYGNLVVRVAKALGFQLYQPELFEDIDYRSHQHLGASANGSFSYFGRELNGSRQARGRPIHHVIYVMMDELDYPIATIYADKDYELLGIDTIVDKNQDDGLLGYLILDLHFQDILTGDDATPSDLVEHGWGNAEGNQSSYDGDWCYAEILYSSIRFNYRSYRYNDEGDEEEVIVEDDVDYNYFDRHFSGEDRDEYSLRQMANLVITNEAEWTEPDDDANEIHAEASIVEEDREKTSAALFRWYDWKQCRALRLSRQTS